MPTSMVE